MIDYLRDPDAITAQSYDIIRREADLTGLRDDLADVALRMIHATGWLELPRHLRASEDAVEKIAFALVEGAPILCDSEMVRAGISTRHLRGSAVVATLNDPGVPALAARLGTTRSAAAVELWRPRLAGPVDVIGNAPTALFHLLDMLDAGAPKPAAILATPVGFVGAEEAKAELALDLRAVPYLTVLGRAGGSAMAAAALNAIARSRDR
jgi:precorrin-8X/cobalt-precorrin-8 methylmutase